MVAMIAVLAVLNLHRLVPNLFSASTKKLVQEKEAVLAGCIKLALLTNPTGRLN
jgi:hypothetical protein